MACIPLLLALEVTANQDNEISALQRHCAAWTTLFQWAGWNYRVLRVGMRAVKRTRFEQE
jgi:hypothetical protein